MFKVSGRTIISFYEAGGLNESSRRKLALLVTEDELGGDIQIKYACSFMSVINMSFLSVLNLLTTVSCLFQDKNSTLPCSAG